MPPELASSVPREILVNVLAPLLEPSDLAPLRAVCRDWRDAFSDQEVWLNKLTSLVATFTSCDLEQAEGEPHMAWHARRAAVVAAPERRRDGLVRPRSRPCGPGPGLRLRPVYGRTRRPTTPPEARRSARRRARRARRARRTPAASAAATGRRPRRPRCVRDVARLGGGARRPAAGGLRGRGVARAARAARVCRAVRAGARVGRAVARARTTSFLRPMAIHTRTGTTAAVPRRVAPAPTWRPRTPLLRSSRRPRQSTELPAQAPYTRARPSPKRS